MSDVETPPTPPTPGPTAIEPAGRHQTDLPLRRHKLTVAYDGSGFHGWQRQHPPGEEPLRTVQGVLDDTLCELLKQPISTIGASRTDRGVHAFGQVVQVDARCPIPIERLAEATNARLPHDMEVRSAEIVPLTFDAIQGARSKQYRYRIWNSPHRPLGLRNGVYHYWLNLDIGRMRDAAARLVGEHDFEGFAAAKHGRLSTVRTVFACDVEQHDEASRGGEPEVHVVISGSGFLYNMVRIITGTLLEIGHGRFEPSQIDAVLASRDRRQAGFTAPPNGLYLEWIKYE